MEPIPKPCLKFGRHHGGLARGQTPGVAPVDWMKLHPFHPVGESTSAQGFGTKGVALFSPVPPNHLRLTSTRNVSGTGVRHLLAGSTGQAHRP